MTGTVRGASSGSKGSTAWLLALPAAQHRSVRTCACDQRVSRTIRLYFPRDWEDVGCLAALPDQQEKLLREPS